MKLDQQARVEHVKRVHLAGREAAVTEMADAQLAAAEAQHAAQVKKLREQIEDQQQALACAFLIFLCFSDFFVCKKKRFVPSILSMPS